jgi:oxygen-independent coproporphyrinogen-3 oxidase
MQALKPLARPRDVLGELGLYVHIPFCAQRCWYCDFNAYGDLDHLIDDYMTTLVAETESLDDVFTSVFIGGGTPSRVDASWIARLLGAVTLAPAAEVTIECNPESTDEAKLDGYLRAGVNRISFGVQSLDNDLLKRLGRLHDAEDALRALRQARSVGFENVSADLIFGVPGETDDLWRGSIQGVLDCDVDHMSCYALIYEEGTPLDSWRKLGKVVPVPDDDVARRWEVTNSILEDAGLARYEVSNWGRPSRHNSLYWAGGEYVGLGAGAHSYIAPTRFWNVKSPMKYIAADGRIAGSEEIDARTRAVEVMMLGLRRTDGVDVEVFERLVGCRLEDLFGDALSHELLSFDGRFLRCTEPLLLNEAALLFA